MVTIKDKRDATAKAHTVNPTKELENAVIEYGYNLAIRALAKNPGIHRSTVVALSKEPARKDPLVALALLSNKHCKTAELKRLISYGHSQVPLPASTIPNVSEEILNLLASRTDLTSEEYMSVASHDNATVDTLRTVYDTILGSPESPRKIKYAMQQVSIIRLLCRHALTPDDILEAIYDRNRLGLIREELITDKRRTTLPMSVLIKVYTDPKIKREKFLKAFNRLTYSTEEYVQFFNQCISEEEVQLPEVGSSYMKQFILSFVEQ